MASDPLPIDEIERLAHYDLMAYLESPCFAFGGIESSERLARMCAVGPGQRVLFVGCGTGETARHWARSFDVEVTGIDSSAHMIGRAREHLEGDPTSACFDRGSAYALDFPDACFDIVVTELVAGLLDVSRAFREFHRVLKPRGRLGINELCREEDAPERAQAAIALAERGLRDLTELPFHIPACSQWARSFRDAGFGDMTIERHPVSDYARRMTLDAGRRRALDRMRSTALRHARSSERIRRRLEEMRTVERQLLFDATVARHLRYALVTGARLPGPVVHAAGSPQAPS